MEDNRRFTILTFPQYFDGTSLNLNLVFMPRNQNPLMAAIEGAFPPIKDAPAFADAKLTFEAKIVSDLSGGLPNPVAASSVALTTAQPAHQRILFEALAKHFTITNLGAHNTSTNLKSYPRKAEDPLPVERSVKKYLPLSYRRSFNFVAPRSRNAVTDDSYFCAVRDAKPNPAFKMSPEEVSWGNVFAYAMRQPLLAEALGMIYRTSLKIEASHFPKGGWLYVDLADGSGFKEQQKADGTFIKRYAARIPALTPGSGRPVFAAIQFPVASVSPDYYDTIFIEAADYDDGFGKIVHAFQAVSDNLLVEESDGFHPTKESGIRLGWDDEQILIWYMRQLAIDERVGPADRLDAPVGIFGYRIDVRPKTEPPGKWESLNLVSSKQPEKHLWFDSVDLGEYDQKELNYQVYPTQIDGDSAKNYWLPMYFANWNGKSMVLPDVDAAAIYQLDKAAPVSGTHVSGAPGLSLSSVYEAAPLSNPLVYGGIYEFQVRLGDMSGGGPGAGRDPVNKTSSQIATVRFKRFVAPTAPRIKDLPSNQDEYWTTTSLSIRRPLLGYPAVVFTGKYADPVALLKQASLESTKNGAKTREAFGIADPDVECVEITVEVQTLNMDNLMSVSGKESYIKLYTTTRKFPGVSPIFDDELVIPIEYRDCEVLNFGDPGNLGDLSATQAEIDDMIPLVLPSARVVRLTVRAVCAENDNYYGMEKADHEFNTRYGRTVQFQLYQKSQKEAPLFVETSLAKRIQGIYLQPDPPFVFDGNPLSVLVGKEVAKAPDMIQRLAHQLGLESKGMTLVGEKGRRVQFGCSQKIRHTLSPDNSSISFASKGDLMNHWLCCITLELNRDWTWDALQERGCVILRQQCFKEQGPVDAAQALEVGDIEVKRTVPFNALDHPDRSGTTLIFIDAVEPKKTPQDMHPLFPDLVDVRYTVKAGFKTGHAVPDDAIEVLQLELPITVPPAQVPKIVSAGIALSPYSRNEKYSTTEPRRRFLWLEFEEPVLDPKDTCFARVLAYAPDQLISNNNPELLVSPDEPVLPVDAEYIRVITPNQPQDDAGIDAMQPMEKSIKSDRHYLLPLPPALHAESSEMFGFFTYEFRIGHFKYTDNTPVHKEGQSVWTTAQGRFGRALRTTGVQHPAPTLTCVVNRDEEKAYVTAPYAVAVANGKNVTADPPRTELWCLLYAQVKQADNRDFRNVLLDDRKLDWRVRVEHRKNVDWQQVYTEVQQTTLKKIALKNWKNSADIGQLAHMYQLVGLDDINKDATRYGTVIWTCGEINQLLSLYGLPPDSALSALCVEILPQITDIYEHVSHLGNSEVQSKLQARMPAAGFPTADAIETDLTVKSLSLDAVTFNEPRPLSDKLGEYRILRTSPLTEVPFVCSAPCSTSTP